MSRAATVLMVLAVVSAARAAPLRLHGYAEAAAGPSIPAFDSNYTDLAQTTFKVSVRGGLELWKFKRVGFAPEAQLDISPVDLNDKFWLSLEKYGSYYEAYRYRFLLGGRLLVDFGIGAVYARFLAGIDYIKGLEQRAEALPTFVDISSTAFTLQPGIGVQFRFLRHMTAGVSLDFPVTFLREDRAFVLPSPDRSAATDVDALGTLGFRI